MPVTAKLSRRFYETFGDELTNELVEWFNLVDATYRSELRELNDQNFAKFAALLEQRIAELRSEMEAGFARFDALLQQRIAELRSEMGAGFAKFDALLQQRIAELRGEIRSDIAALRADLIKWMFLFWAGTALTLVGLLRF